MFTNSYIYIKKYEQDYGMQLKALCEKVETAFHSTALPKEVTDTNEKKIFYKKLAER